MTTLKKMALHLPWILALLMPRFVLAHGGEDHGDEARAPVSLSASGPQLELKSPEVELLGNVRNGKLTVYADRYATNEPILNAKIELEREGRKLPLRPAQGGSYTAAADWVKQPGLYEVVVSMEANGLEDLLIGTLPQNMPAGIAAKDILFLPNFRTTFISLTASPISIPITVLVFKYFGLSINTMTLGGRRSPSANWSTMRWWGTKQRHNPHTFSFGNARGCSQTLSHPDRRRPCSHA